MFILLFILQFWFLSLLPACPPSGRLAFNVVALAFSSALFSCSPASSCTTLLLYLCFLYPFLHNFPFTHTIGGQSLTSVLLLLRALLTHLENQHYENRLGVTTIALATVTIMNYGTYSFSIGVNTISSYIIDATSVSVDLFTDILLYSVMFSTIILHYVNILLFVFVHHSNVLFSASEIMVLWKALPCSFLYV